ncbi:MAG: FAD-dependent oxidoreductase, partial [Synergistaceae bacterium]|nr:FAD-dependent oxidoreductase [Synergistaceae bacterium]
MRLVILGGGLAGISLAYFLQNEPDITTVDIIEKESRVGGLCRSFIHDGRFVDIGPHIFFSKDGETLSFMLDILGDNVNSLRRSNRIIHKDRFVQYPFENDLSRLPREDCERCLKEFLDNPYRDYEARNMLQFFLKTFGQGITDLYLRPYNEKIWKFDPSFMDTQMVERIPRPPDEDIMRSAAGETVDGYTHQLYFSYPKAGGTAAFIDAFAGRLNEKVKIHTSRAATSVRKENAVWRVEAGGAVFEGDILVSCIPVNILAGIYEGIGQDVARRAEDLRYNNIMIAVATVSKDRAGDNFAFMTADRGVIFHRVSKLDFLGEEYARPGTATYMMEYTYRGGDPRAGLSDGALTEEFRGGLKRIGFVENDGEILSFTVKK